MRTVLEASFGGVSRLHSQRSLNIHFFVPFYVPFTRLFVFLEMIGMVWVFVVLDFRHTKVLYVERFSNVKTCLLGQSLLRLLYGGLVENLICLQVVCEHLFKLIIDLLVQIK